MHVRKLNDWLSNTSQSILIFRCQDLSLLLKTHVRLLFVLFFLCVWKQRNITIRVYLHSEKNDQFSVSSIPVMMYIESMMMFMFKSMMFVVMMMILYHRYEFFFCVMDWFMHLHWMVNIDMHGPWNSDRNFYYAIFFFGKRKGLIQN